MYQLALKKAFCVQHHGGHSSSLYMSLSAFWSATFHGKWALRSHRGETNNSSLTSGPAAKLHEKRESFCPCLQQTDCGCVVTTFQFETLLSLSLNHSSSYACRRTTNRKKETVYELIMCRFVGLQFLSKIKWLKLAHHNSDAGLNLACRLKVKVKGFAIEGIISQTFCEKINLNALKWRQCWKYEKEKKKGTSRKVISE